MDRRLGVTPRTRLLLRLAAGIILLPVAAYGALALVVRPTNDRDWSPDQARLVRATFDGDSVHIANVRNARYRSVSDYDVRWENRSYDLQRLESVWFIVEPFSDLRGPAHTFLSFGFAGGEFVAISVELRKEVGETFHPLRGLLRQYELQYVVGDERDLLGLRANHRRDSVFVYPVRTTPEKQRELFRAMLERANGLAEHPEFYNTLWSSCTTNIVAHINAIAPKRVPFSFKVLLPAYSDELAYDLGLLDTTLPRDGFRLPHLINGRAAEFADREDFSAGIRRELGD